MSGLPTLREVRLRYVRYYLQLAQENRNDLAEIVVEIGNITQAANFCVELADWHLLGQLTDTINDYLLRSGQWSIYIKFSASLVTNDLTDHTDERVARISQLIELEEMRGNYAEVLRWSEMLVSLHSQNQHSNVDAAIEALKKIARLTAARGRYDESIRFLHEGLLLARQVGMLKGEADLLFEFALLHKQKLDFDRAEAYCESSLQVARSIGYSIKEIDILALMASLSILQHRLEAALGLYDRVLASLRAMGDTVREDSTLAEMIRLREIIRLKKRKIFISYNHEDRGFVDRLANDLKARELPVWWDQWEIKVGDSIIQKVSDGIAGSAYLIAVLSPHSVKSEWVQREIGSVLMKELSVDKNITILTLLLADCEVPVLLREIKWADFRRDYKSGLQSLLQVLVVSD